MSTQKRLFTAMTPSFCSLTDTKQSLQYTIKTYLSGPPMPKFEANMNYIPPSPPSSMKQCNKSATVKFHMELLLTTTTRKQSRSGATPHVFPGFLTSILAQLSFQSHRLLFSNASAGVRGENTQERKFASTGSRTHNHQVMSSTRSPLNHPAGAV